MKKMRTHRILSIALCLCMALALLAGCGEAAGQTSPATQAPQTNTANDANTAPGGPANNGPAEGSTNLEAGENSEAGTYFRDKITVSASADGGSLDPYTRSNWGNAILTSILFQHLANIDADGNTYNELAKEINKVDDTHYEIVLWDNIHDSEGNPLTADDVIWSFDQYLAAGNKGGVNKFDHFDKVDDYTLTFVLSSPFTAGEYEKNMSNCPVITQAAYEAAGNDMTTSPVGTGPYKLKSYTPGSSVVLEAVEDFWMNDLGIDLPKWEAQNSKEIEFQIIQDASSRAIALEMGTIDIADSLDAADVSAFASNPDVAPVLMPQDPPIAFIYNCSDASPFHDVNLRKAVAYALDNEAIVAAMAVPAVEVYGIEPRMWDAPEEWLTGRDYYNYDAAKAEELKNASSYAGETLRLQYTSDAATEGAAIMIQSQLGKVGINVDLVALEESVRMVEKYDETKWDFRLETLGGGNYLTQTLKSFSSADAAAHLDGGKTIMMIPEAHLDELWDALVANTNSDTISAWDDYFTYEQCYAYAICCFSNQTCARSDVNVVLAGTRYQILPNAATFND